MPFDTGLTSMIDEFDQDLPVQSLVDIPLIYRAKCRNKKEYQLCYQFLVEIGEIDETYNLQGGQKCLIP